MVVGRGLGFDLHVAARDGVAAYPAGAVLFGTARGTYGEEADATTQQAEAGPPVRSMVLVPVAVIEGV